MHWFLNRLWILAIFAFVVLIGSWVILFVLADKNRPESVEIQSRWGQATDIESRDCCLIIVD
jgi:hypothetical protein